jgi:predicted porin
MKKTLLLGTTALFAAGVATSGTALAEDPITLGISGFMASAIGAVQQDDGAGQLADDNNSFVFGNNSSITFQGDTTLDNGITVGAYLQVEGNSGGNATSGSNALDERFAFFKGSFGQLRVGQVEDAAQSTQKSNPGGTTVFGVNSPFFQFGNSTPIGFAISTYSDGLGNQDAIRAVYYSPTFNGFQLAASYAPDDANNGQYGGNVTNAAGGLQNATSVGLTFSGNMGEAGVNASAGWSSYVLENCNASEAIQTCEDHPDVLGLGGSVSFGGFSIGASYKQKEQITHDTNGNARDRVDTTAGVSYATGPYKIGLEYGNVEIDQTDITSDEVEKMEVNGSYVLGPGLSLDVALTNGDANGASAGELDNSFTTFKVGSWISF